MRKFPLYSALIILIILLLQGGYSVYRLQKIGYDVERILIPLKGEGARGFLLFVYADPDLQNLRKIIYCDKDLSLNLQKESVPGAEMRSIGFSCRFVGKLRAEKGGQYRIFLKFAGGVIFLLDGKVLVDSWSNRGWKDADLGKIELTAGWHSFEARLRLVDYGGFLNVSWVRPKDNMFRTIKASDLKPDIP